LTVAYTEFKTNPDQMGIYTTQTDLIQSIQSDRWIFQLTPVNGNNYLFYDQGKWAVGPDRTDLNSALILSPPTNATCPEDVEGPWFYYDNVLLAYSQSNIIVECGLTATESTCG